MQPYLIEGLDCSGKKSVAGKIKTLLEHDGFQVELIIGPLFGEPLRRVDNELIRKSYIKDSKWISLFRKPLYIIEPALDGAFYHAPKLPRIVIKISSHYRAWARATVESDHYMEKGFAKLKRFHPQYAGTSLIYTNFDERIRRHRADYALGTTTKDEIKRFFSNDRLFFDQWHNQLARTIYDNQKNVYEIDSTNMNIESVGDLVHKHIMRYIRNE